jgi:hypothetical protein
MKLVEYTEGRGKNGRRVEGTKLMLFDTLRGLELHLGKHLRLFTQEHEHELEPNSNPLLELLKFFARPMVSDSELDQAISALDEVAPQ